VPTLQDGLNAKQPPLTSVRKLLERVAYDEPRVSLKKAVRYAINATEERKWSQTITTPPGTALGGIAEITIRGDGMYAFRVQMENTGLPDYAFSVVVHLQAATAPPMALTGQKSSVVEGHFSSGPSFFNETENLTSRNLKLNWETFRDSSAFHATKEWKLDGLLGDLQWLGEVFLGYLAVNAIAGGPIAALVIIGNELVRDQPASTGPTAAVGIIAAAGVLWLCGPTMLIPAIGIGLGVGSYSFEKRNLNADEITVAQAVFGTTLDNHFDRIYVTDLHHFPPGDNPNRAMTACMPNGDILICVGNNFTKPYTAWNNVSTLVHELVHAWQAIHVPQSIDRIWEAIANEFITPDEERYDYSLGDRWDSMNVEAQASAVGNWYENNISFPRPSDPLGLRGLTSETAYADPDFNYVANNIRTALD
jgi:hypothetical protein